jgi:hypothetical protein
MIVRNDFRKPLSSDDRTVLPDLISSFRRSKYTTYESTVTPTDTMMPVTPASVSARPRLADKYETSVKNSRPVSARPLITTSPSSR